MPDYSVCDRCGNHGLTVVPHPDYVVMGEWQPHHSASGDGCPVYYTAVVCCSCSKGGKLRDHFAAHVGPKPMTLEQYRERVLPEPERVMKDAKATVDYYRSLTPARMTTELHSAAKVAESFRMPR